MHCRRLKRRRLRNLSCGRQVVPRMFLIHRTETLKLEIIGSCQSRNKIGMSLTVRKLCREDYLDWHKLWEGYLNFYGVTLSEEITRETWKRINDDSFEVHGLGAATEDDLIVGIVHYLYHPVTWSIAPRCYLEDLYVSEEARGRGAGQALVEAVYQAARERQADQVYWLTENENLQARKLYDRIGELTSFVKYKGQSK